MKEKRPQNKNKQKQKEQTPCHKWCFLLFACCVKNESKKNKTGARFSFLLALFRS
jgi:hypothetical protein